MKDEVDSVCERSYSYSRALARACSPDLRK